MYKIKLLPTIIAIIFIALFLILIITRFVYAQKIYPNIFAAGVNLGGKDEKAGEKILVDNLAEFQKEAIFTLSMGNNEWEYRSEDLGIQVNMEKTIDAAFDYGRSGNFLKKSLQNLKAIFSGKRISVVINFDDAKLEQALSQPKAQLETPYSDAQIFIDETDVIITPEAAGQKLNLLDLKISILDLYNSQKSGKIQLKISTAYPEKNKEQMLHAKEEAEDIIAEPIKLRYKNYKYSISRITLASWIYFAPKSVPEEIQPALQFNKYFPIIRDCTKETLHAQLSDKKITSYVKYLATKIDILPVDAKLKFDEGLKIVQSDIEGRSANTKKLAYDIKQVSSSSKRDIQINVEKKLADIRKDNYKTLGIDELISEGKSDFAGSPENRKHNIAVGASKFNGIIIKPDEEFSYNKTLGRVDETTGYLPELVIKEDQTIPEFGGGLCQTSTTFFRAAILAGLPILERKNHAYRVKYYDWPYGPGVDATIYLPHPDVRIKNDTGNYILIQTSVSGNILSYSFYGTKGGRFTKIEGLKILEENPDGSMKTEFYQVIYQNGVETKRVRFFSKYDSPSKFPKPTPEAPETAP